MCLQLYFSTACQLHETYMSYYIVLFLTDLHPLTIHVFYNLQENDLKRVFLFALQVLYEIERQPSPLSRETTAVLNRLLSITESVLCWEFTPKLSKYLTVLEFVYQNKFP